MQRPNRKYIISLHPRPNNLQPNFIILLNHSILLRRLITRRITLRIKLHIPSYTIPRNKTSHRPNFCINTNFINLRNCPVDHFSFEWFVDYGFVFDWVLDEASGGEDDAGADGVYGGDGHDEAVFAGAGAFDFGEELLFDGFD